MTRTHPSVSSSASVASFRSRGRSHRVTLLVMLLATACGKVAEGPPRAPDAATTLDASKTAGADAGTTTDARDAAHPPDDASIDSAIDAAPTRDAADAGVDATPFDAAPRDGSVEDASPADATAPPPLCNNGTNQLSFVVTGSYGGLPNGASQLTEGDGDWVATYDLTSTVELNSKGTPPWGFTLNGGPDTSVTTGTFDCGPSMGSVEAYFSVNGQECQGDVTCAVTILQLTYSPGGSGGPIETIDQFKASFTLGCGDAGVTGCINYIAP